MEEKENTIEKNWSELTKSQKDTTTLIFKRTLLNCYLITSKTETKLNYSYLEQNKPSLSLTLKNDIEIVQNVNISYLKALIIKTQNDFFKKNGYGVHKEYLDKLPDVVSLDEIFEAKNLKSK